MSRSSESSFNWENLWAAASQVAAAETVEKSTSIVNDYAKNAEDWRLEQYLLGLFAAVVFNFGGYETADPQTQKKCRKAFNSALVTHCINQSNL